jgi:hypothetical protein
VTHGPNPVEAILRALESKDPSALKEIIRAELTWDDLLKLRRVIMTVTVESQYYDLLFQWMWHTDDSVARAVRTILLFLDDPGVNVAVFHRLAEIPPTDIPFVITYDNAEKEFRVELPEIPGWCVSHYGRDDPNVDLLLAALERLYARMHPEHVPPPYFRLEGQDVSGAHTT